MIVVVDGSHAEALLPFRMTRKQKDSFDISRHSALRKNTGCVLAVMRNMQVAS